MVTDEQQLHGYKRALEILEKYKPKKFIASRYYNASCACAVGAIAESFGAKEMLATYDNPYSIMNIDRVYQHIQKNSVFEVMVNEIPIDCLMQIQTWNDDSLVENSSKRYTEVCSKLRERISSLDSPQG